MDPFGDLDITIHQGRISTKSPSGIRHKQIKITLEEIRSQLMQIGDQKPYTNENQITYYDSHVENFNLPFINFIFYYLFTRDMKVPTLDEIVSTYLSIYCNIREDGKIQCRPQYNSSKFAFSKETLVGRIYRSSNSFYRELELLFQLMRYDDIDASYNFHDDIDGIDFTVICNGISFYLASYVGTSRAHAWKKVKDKNRHATGNQLIDIIAYINENSPRYNTVCYNGIYTYAPNFIAGKYVEILQKAGV